MARPPRRPRRPGAGRSGADQQPTEPGLQGTRVQLKRDRQLLKAGYTFDTDEADRVCEFFEDFLRHSKGEWAGKPFTLQPWQRAVLRRLFGWRRPDGTRRYRKLYEEVPRKNGKSTFAAGVALFLTFSDRELGADVFGAATDKNQAKLVFNEAKSMVEASPELKAISQVYKSAIIVPETRSCYQPISSESTNKDGLNPHGVIVDELHEWGPSHRELWEKLTTAMGARRQPLICIFTTAGSDPNSLWAEEREYAKRVAAGEVVNDEYLAVLYGADPDDDWKDEEVWRRANPGYGVTVKPDFLRSELREALEKPRKVPAFKRYYLNILTGDSDGGLSMEAWDACRRPLDEDALAGRRCWVGLDLSRRTDMTAAAAVFPLEDGFFAILPRFYIPEDNIEAREKRDKVPIRLWVEQGLVVATPGNVIDYAFVRADINLWARTYEVVEVPYDPNSATQLALQLTEDGISVFEHPQTFLKLSEPTKKFEELVLQHRIVHGGNPVMRWQVRNVALKIDANENVRPDKRKSTSRIDVVVASIMALGRATLGGDGAYEDHGIRTL
jgi:phage terminase large subunit-like protein